MYPKFIGLYGPDGVGKSTQVDILTSEISSNGYSVRKVWIRGPHTFAFILSSLLVRLGLYREIVNPFGRVKRIPVIGARSLDKHIWVMAEFIGVLPIVFFRVIIPLKLGYIVVADRYVMDTIVSIAYHINDVNFTQGKLARSLMSLIPKRSLFFHLDADYDTLMKRRGRLVEPRDFISFQKECYSLLSKIIPSVRIDTSVKNKRMTEAFILKKIKDFQIDNN